MKILITERFLENIPNGRKVEILGKLNRFVKDYQNSGFNMAGMRHGTSVREIGNNRHGLRIFKFRVSKSDRVLFTFDVSRLRPQYRQSILFLDYVLHDKQGTVGRMIGMDNQQLHHLEEEAVFDTLVDAQFRDFEYDPNEIITRVIDIETMAGLFDQQDEKVVYYLNDEQYECLQAHDSPSFLFGSAGSGKTTINIYKLFLLASNPMKVAYFTYSNYLVEDAKKLYNKIKEESGKKITRGKIDFFHLLDYMSSETKAHQLVLFPEFSDWIAAHHPVLLKQVDAEILDIYKEIRGVLKGMVPKEWITYEIPSEWALFSPGVKEALVQGGFAKTTPKGLLLFPEKLYAAKREFLEPSILQGVLLMHRFLDYWLVDHPIMDLQVYLGLDQHYSTFERPKREAVYQIAMSYQQYLTLHEKIDENDLARIFLKRILEENTMLFDYVVADEIQDLTEIQVYLLIKLSKNRNHLLFTGDANQTIRPTYFHMGRIESLMKVSNTHLAFIRHRLTRNYRSSKEIVELANTLIDLRVEVLGRDKKNDYLEHAVRNRGAHIIYCKFDSPKDIHRLLETGIMRHYVAIVVPTLEEKKQLQRQVSVRGAIFTVEEIKGIEKDYIICYNITSRYKEVWEKLLTQDSASVNIPRYYFNLLYVAITRSRQRLVIIEEDMPPSLLARLQNHFLIKESFEESGFSLETVSTLNQFHQEAQLYEQRELYEQAINEYRLAGSEKDIKRCKALMKNQEGSHLEAGHELTKLGFHSLAARCYRQGGDKANHLRALINQGLSYEKLETEFGSNVLDFVFSHQGSHSWTGNFYKIYRLWVMKRLQTLDYINEHINKMEGGRP